MTTPKGRILAPGENLKEKQQKLKEEREAKRAQLDERHHIIIQQVAHTLGIDKQEAEDSLLEGNQVEQITKFFAARGSSRLLFYFQEPDAETEQRNIVPVTKQVRTTTKSKVFLAQARDTPLRGQCLMFIRQDASVAITSNNISKEVNFMQFEAGAGNGILKGIESLLTTVFIPSLRSLQQGWGPLETGDGQKQRNNFLNRIESFVGVLDGARSTLENKITLKPCETYDLSRIKTPADCLHVASSTESLTLIDQQAAVWIQQIEQVLAEAEQIRKEADNVGPRAELDYWKNRATKFNHLLDQVKSTQVKAVLGVLQAAKSRSVKIWQDLDRRITDAANDAKDNVKFLYTLEQFSEPLYNSDPPAMLDSIPGLINSIRLINSISRYYNTSEKMTALFVKITNQMIAASKAYLTNDGSETIWTQPTDQLLKKIAHCLKLNEEYQRHFHKTKAMLEEMPDERKFDFSEMYIFGKFDTFCRRLRNIVEMFQSIEVCIRLADAKIEGLDSLITKGQVIITTMKKKQYDYLDQRRAEVDNDFEEFKRQMFDLFSSVSTFAEQATLKITDTKRALTMLRKFESLKLPQLYLDDKYAKVLQHYGRDLDAVTKLYHKQKNDPIIARDTPLVAGRIMWSRQLYHRISAPIEIFEKVPNLLSAPTSKKIVKAYNRLAKVLLEFELLYYRAWCRQIDVVKQGLLSSLLVRRAESNELMVNFDPQILGLIKEADLLSRMGLEIPPSAFDLLQKQTDIKRVHGRLVTLLDDIKQLYARIPPEYVPLMEPHRNRLNAALEPAMISINWTSVNIDRFLDNVYNTLNEINLLLGRAQDLREFRIDRVLSEMQDMTLCEMPSDDDPWNPDEFLHRTTQLCVIGSNSLQQKSMNVEDAVNELINMLCDEQAMEPANVDPVSDEGEGEAEEGDEKQDEENGDKKTQRSTERPKSQHTQSIGSALERRKETLAERKRREMRERIDTAAMELLNHFNFRNVDAIVKVTRNALETLRKRIYSTMVKRYGMEQQKVSPFFKTSAELIIPAVVMQPTLEEVQQIVIRVANLIISVSKGISQWTKQRKRIGFDPLAPQPGQGEHDDAEDGGEQADGEDRRANSALSVTASDAEHLPKSRRGREMTEDTPKQGADHLVVQTKNYFRNVSDNKEIAKLLSLLGSAISTNKKEMQAAIESFSRYSAVWEQAREVELERFLKQQPKVGEFEAAIIVYEQLEFDVAREPPRIDVGPIGMMTEKFRLSVLVETKQWRLHYGKACNQKYRGEMESIFAFIDDLEKRLSRPINDLDDIRVAMAALKEIREHEIRIDMTIGPIEESYAMLNKHELPVAREETERVDTLRYTWHKLQTHAIQVQDSLLGVQPNFRGELLANVEVFKQECEGFYSYYARAGPNIPGIPPREASDALIICQNSFDNLFRKYITYSGGEELFGIPVTEYPQLMQIKKEMALLQKLYGLYNDVLDTVSRYYEIPWTDVNTEMMNTQLSEFQNRCRKLPKGLKEYQAYNDLAKSLNDFLEMVPLLELMTNKAMQRRHWQRISDTMSHQLDIESEGFTLRNVLEAPLLKYKEELEDICISAGKEKDIEAKLKSVMNDWNNRVLAFANFKSRGELLLRGDTTQETISAMEDSLMILSSLLSNRYNAPFKKQIQQWTQNLSNTSEIIDQWMIVQNLWVYLEAVFVGGDIAKQLPKEAKRFQAIDKSWIKIMSRAHDITNVVQCCVGDDTLRQLLPHLQEQLELCQKSLTGYLEKKRLLFPRFFFVSDPALLEILGQASDPHTIQNHLLSIFDNVKSVKFHEKQYELILSIISSEGETVELERPIRAEGNVEVWLLSLMQSAHRSLHGVIRQAAMAIQDQGFNLLEFLGMFPAQIGLLGIQMLWTRDATEALTNAKSDRKIMQHTNQNFLDLLNMMITQTTRDLSSVERTKFETLITIHVHQRDIFDDLCKLHIKTPTDFEWLKQTRFYFMEDTDTMLISITDADFEYQNEFLGCTERLVITPLTDRCYITIAQALLMSMGGAPAGPAGTGKTETVKDMGRCLGKYVVVFNCSDQMDFRGLGRIFKGLAQSGSWGCFDEFNRIELPVLSVAAQQIYTVLQCRKERRKQFIFTDGDSVDMNPEFGLFLTMNPGYAGRQELPENLKINFRSVAMIVPDRQVIIRVKLASAGFIDNIILSKKFYTLYKLCEEQLTKQVHYDFGLRNILSVLRTLGRVKRSNPSDSEQTTVMRVLRDMNLSKLIDQDEPLFMSLINDLFPGITLEKAGYPELEAAISKQIEEAKLINHPSWFLKVIQLFETQRVRHGMMALGPSGAGKTCCIHTLMKAMTDCGEPHREWRMNPKAITASQMFGRLDVATNDWTDGIFSALWRRTLRMKKNEHVWIVLDGPVDAIWIENLNSVLDDTKKLTLANGDRIPMAPNCKLVFEPHNVDNASPATVSRNGMVFMSSSALDWNPILRGWLKRTYNMSDGEMVASFFETSFSEILNFSLQNLAFKMDVLEAFIIRQCCDLLQGLIPKRESERESFITRDHMERLYVFTLMWSIGALLELDDRAKFENFLFSHPTLRLDLPPTAEVSDSSMFDFYVADDGVWQHWNKRVTDYVYPPDSTPEYSGILVPNVDNVRTEFLIQTIAKQEKAVLLIGEPGSAKSVMIQGYMNKYNPETHASKTMNFSSATTPNLFQRTIESYVDKRVGTTFGPPAGRKMTVFIDDINMPNINEWGDQIANEIVRQLMEMKGFYSLEKPGDFTTIVDIQFVAAMIHPGGGRNDIPQRLKRQFNVFNCTLPSNNSIDKIFSVIGCGHFNERRGFREEVRNMITRLVPLTRRLWQLTKIKMLPTPAKFHYIFNLRDLSRIWQGMLNAQGSVMTDTRVLLSLWKHECSRVIADRFVNDDDIKWFDKTMKRILSEDFNDEVASVVDQTSWFVDFLRDAPEATGDESDDADMEMPKIYEPIASFEQLDERLRYFEGQYNETIRGSGLDLVFFKDAMTHLVKISRIIRTPKGHALLVGVGGSGKQSLTKLASFIAGYKSFQVTLTRSYNVSNFVEDLKFLYRTAGGQGKGITFVFTDQEVKDEAFLEYMNNVLASGIVSGLFARDEMDEMLNDLISPMKKEWPRKPPSNENLYEYFMYRIRLNLHVVLCFSPVGEKFRNRSLKFPGLISGCTMDWFQRWPKEALVAVADHYLREFPIDCSPDVKRQVIQLMGNLHDGVAESCVEYFQRFRRQAHVTPKSYLSFLNGYKQIYEDRYKQVKSQNDRMLTGLAKLDEAQVTVEELSKELVVKEKELAVANEKAEAVLKEVTAKAQAAEKVKAQVQKVKDKAQAIVDSIATDKAIAEEKLEKAKPALEEAEAALNTIKPADIATVKKLGKPPHLIMRIMDCVLVLVRRRLDVVSPDPERPCCKPSWGESLKLMSGNLLGMLLDYPKDTINDEMVELLEPYFEMDDFNLETAKKVSGNVAGLLSWTKAMFSFFYVNKEVLPLKANLVVQEARLLAANRDLQTAQAQLDEKERELNAVKAEYDAAMAYKQRLQDEAEACRRKMKAASALISGLGSEKIRWTEQSKEFQAQMGRLVGDVILATAFLSYSGPFNQEFRRLVDRNWQKELRGRKIPLSQNVNVIDMLTDPNMVAEWNLQGLPNDELSVQNGIIVTKAPRFPLLIDPQGQGKIWIKNRELKNDMAITALNHKYFRQHLEDALSLGRPLLIEDIGEELDPALDNVLERNFIKQGSTLKVKVGDKEVDVMSGFRLFITTKLSNPRYTPEISARTSIIDFAVTMKGLEDQLLGRVVLTEKAELENERVRLMEEVTSNKRKIKELEDNLLYRLTNTEGSLVDDEELIIVLDVSKTTAADVSQKLQIAAETEVKINSAREEYRPVATRGSILYFLITEMSLVNAMYQTSLRQFLGLFDLSMARSQKSPIPQKRIQNIIEFMTFEVWKYAVRGLYEADKMTFTLLLALKIDMQQNRVKYEEFQTFVKGGASLDLNVVQPKPFRWVSDIAWLNLVELSNLHQFSGILDQVSRNEKGWKVWFDKDAPEEEVIPDGYNTTLDVFRRLLLVRSWCPDRTLSQAKKYIGDSLGEKYAEGFILDVERVWEESDPRSPMVGLLSMGSDPTPNIETLGKKHRLEVRAISMGQGQEVHARRLVQQSMQNGGWVLLQNCHLSMDYVMEVLDTIVETQQIHDDFRLWVTTEVHPKFPITFLQTSIKFSNEPPQGLKAGLKKTYTGFSPDYLEVSSMPQFKPMVYAVAFLHTTVQERRKFGPLGWNIPYEFNQADLNATLQFVQNHLDDMDIKRGVVWTCVRYMIGEIQYGGRVTDDFDKRLLNTYCKLWFQENMFAPQFLFYKNYPIPKLQRLPEFSDYINTLPNTDTPEIFGLHGNADITYQSKTAKAILDCILNIQPKDSAGGGGETRESIVYKLCDDMLSKLPPDYVAFEVKARLQAMGAYQPMNIFLRQEIDRIQRVLTAVRSTLVDLKLAVDGTIIMNENLRDALDCMFDARIPSSWEKVSWDSSTLGFWFTELIERNTQFYAWLFNGRPSVFWMTGFFNPQGFLTAMRQEVTRAHKGWALDSVVLFNDVTKFSKDDVTHSPPEGVYVYGLYLDGCGFDRRGIKLIEPKPKQLFELLPVIHIYAMNNSQLPDTSKMYVCPVYKKPRRTDLTYIASVYLKTALMPEHWVLRGVALLCDVK